MKPDGRQIGFTILGLLIPLIILFVLNSGHIFKIPNLVDSFKSETTYLATERGNDTSIDVLVGIATIFVVFFVFVQLAYSLRHVPHWFVSNYLIHHEHTYCFVAYFISLLFVEAAFSIDDKIRYVNQTYNSFSIVFSAILIIAYFISFTNKITVKGILKCIMDRFKLDVLIKLEIKLGENRNTLENELSKGILGIQAGPLRGYNFLFDQTGVLKSSKEGLIESINHKKLKKIITPILPDLEAIEFGATIGEWFPKNHNVMMHLIPRSTQNRVPPQQVNRINSFIFTSQEKIESCIKFNNKYRSLTMPLHDMLRAYEHFADESPRELRTVVQQLSRFFKDEGWH